MRRTTGAIVATAMLTIGTASASSLGITGPTTLAADTISVESCTATEVELIPDYRRLRQAPDVETSGATPPPQDTQIPLGAVTGNFDCATSGPLSVDLVVTHVDGTTRVLRNILWTPRAQQDGRITLPVKAKITLLDDSKRRSDSFFDIQTISAVDVVVHDVVDRRLPKRPSTEVAP